MTYSLLLSSTILLIIHLSEQHSINTIFSDQDLQCLSNGTIFYSRDQKCYNLLEKGPCSTREWLVMEARSTGEVQAKCEVCQCCRESSKKIFWTVDGQCHRSSDKLCGKGMKLMNDFDGTGVCVCKEGFAKLGDNSQECLPLFERSTVCPQVRMYLKYDVLHIFYFYYLTIFSSFFLRVLVLCILIIKFHYGYS